MTFSRNTLLFAALAAALALSSCATRVPVRMPADPAASLPEKALVYLRAHRPLLEEAARTLLTPADLKSARSLLARTDRLTASLVLPAKAAEPPGAEAGKGPEPGRKTDPPAEIFGIAEGSYPAGAAAFRLRLSRAWRKDGRTLVRTDGALRVAFAGRQLLAAGTADLEPLLDRLATPGPHPVPEDLRSLWESEAALWIPRPTDLAGVFPGAELSAVPVRGMLLSLGTAGAEDRYAGTWVFEFDSERNARVYGPLCRLVHLALIRAVYGPDTEGADAALDRSAWTSAGSRVTASGFTLRGADLARILGSFLAGAGFSGP